MIRSGLPGPPFNVVLVVSAAHGIILHAPFTSQVAEVVPFGRIRAYGAREENFIMKWADEGCDAAEVERQADEVDDTDAAEGDGDGVHFATFYTAEAPLILESIEQVIEGLLSSKMGVANIDHIIEEVVREKEKAGRPYTKEEILESIDDLVMRKKLDGSSVSSDGPPPMLKEKSLSSEKVSSDTCPSLSPEQRKSSKKKKRKSRKADSAKGKEEDRDSQ